MSAVSFLPPLGILSTQTSGPWKRREWGKIRYMERLFIVNSTGIEWCNHMHVVIIVLSLVTTLSVCDASASSVKHPLFPLFVCFETIPDNPFRVVILFFPLSSAMFPLIICWISTLYTTLVRYFLIFRQFCWFLEWMKTNYTNLKALVVRCVVFAYVLCSLVSETGS